MQRTIRSMNQSLAKLNSELAVPGSPGRRDGLIATGQSLVATTKPAIAADKKELGDGFAIEYASHHGEMPPPGAAPEDESATTCRALFGGAVLVAGFDLAVGALTGEIFLNFSKPIAAMIGVLISVLLSALAAAVCHGILVKDNACPRRVIEILRTQLKFVLPAYVACLIGCLLIGRIVTDSDGPGKAIFACGLLGLEMIGPWVFAVLTRLHGEIGWARKFVSPYEQLCNLERDLEDLELKLPALVGSPAVPRTARTRMSLAAAPVLLLICWGASAEAAESCGSLSIDSSGSVLASLERRQVAASAIGSLQNWAAATGCLDWDLYSFAGAAFSDSAFYTVRFPRRPSGVCPALAPKRSDLTDIFVGPAEADKQQQKKKCQEYVANERQTYESTIADRVAEAQRKFAAYSPVEPEFTAIVDLL